LSRGEANRKNGSQQLLPPNGLSTASFRFLASLKHLLLFVLDKFARGSLALHRHARFLEAKQPRRQ
jgi:hypothetical protein